MLLLNLPAPSLIAFPLLFPPLWGLYFLGWFLPVAMPAVVKTLQKDKIPQQASRYLPEANSSSLHCHSCQDCHNKSVLYCPSSMSNWSFGSWTAEVVSLRSPHHLETTNPCIHFSTKYSIYVFTDFLQQIVRTEIWL